MNIGFDAKRYFHNNSGLGNYSRDLVNTLIRKYPENKYYLFDSNPSTLSLPANTIAAVPVNPTLFWRTYGMVKDIALHNIDVFHGLSNELPRGKWPQKTKKVITVHDVIFKTHPNQYPWLDRNIYHRKMLHGLKVADCIVACSKASADDIIKLYEADKEKVKVVYQTCGEGHWKTYTPDGLNSFAFNKRLPARFMLYVSSFQYRKNHLQLLKAFRQCGKDDLFLVLAGRAGETSKVCSEFIDQNGLKNRVLVLNDLQNSELPLLYRCASSFIYPSLVEGFGIPLLEAACAGLPMAVNDIPVFRELAFEGSLFMNAGETESMCSAIEDLNSLKKTDYGDLLNDFKPEFAAGQIYKIYEDCMKK